MFPSVPESEAVSELEDAPEVTSPAVSTHVV